MGNQSTYNLRKRSHEREDGSLDYDLDPSQQQDLKPQQKIWQIPPVNIGDLEVQTRDQEP